MTIIGLSPKNSIQEAILKVLSDDSIKFYLTGSRFFGWHKPTSDYDFFCQNPETDSGCRIFYNSLTRSGFADVTKCQPEEAADGTTILSYSDKLAVKIFMHPEADIHIQVVKDARLKRIVQEYINRELDLRSILRIASTQPKHVQRLRARGVWNRAIETVKIIHSVSDHVDHDFEN
jgi:hypothetical protein